MSRPGGFTGLDGERSAQAAISQSLAMAPRPPKRPGVPVYYNNTPGIYPALRADVAFIDTDEEGVTTNAGPASTRVFATFGDRPRAKPGREDEWCSRYKVAGIFKNTLTEAQTAMAGVHGGVSRINDQVVGIQLAGSNTIFSNAVVPIHSFTPLIFGPPQDSEDARALPVIMPLHWSCLGSLINQILIAMLAQYGEGLVISHPSYKYSTESAKSRVYTMAHWNNIAREKICFYLTIAMAAFAAFSKKGYIKIMSPTISRKEAMKDKFIYEVSQKIKAGANNADLRDLVKEHEIAMAELSNGNDISDYDNTNRFNSYYHDPASTEIGDDDVVGIYAINREEDVERVTGKLFNDTVSKTMSMAKEHQSAFDWMVQNLELGGSVNTDMVDTITKNTNYDFLQLVSFGALTSDQKIDIKDKYLKFPEEYIDIQSNPIKDAFTSHLENITIQEAVCSQEFRDSVMHRCWAYTLSSTPGEHTGRAGSVGPPTLDVDIGPRFL